MKTTRLLLASAFAASLSLGHALAGGEGWSHDFEAAKKQAAEENKSLLIDFTGSDWCGWCIKLNDEVFQHDAFKDGVKDKFVLVELDYPKDKSKVSEATQKQNAELQEKYAIQGFPTILLTDSSGKPYASTGYQAGGPEKYVSHLDELLAVQAKRDAALATAAKAEGVDKAKALISALNDMGLDDAVVASFYSDVVAEIKAADPKDETGFVANIEAKERFASFERELGEKAQSGDMEGALTFIDKTLADGSFKGEQLQQISMIKGMIYAQTGKFDESLAAMDEAKKVDPDSQLATQIDSFKGRIEQMKAKAADAGATPESKP